MDDNNLFQTIGEFKIKIESLEKSVVRLESSVEKLASTVADNRNIWQVLVTIATVSTFIGAAIHKPFEYIMSLFK